MKKTFLLEQCSRAKAITEDEMRLHKSNNDTWWIDHQEGHIDFINELEEILINHKEQIDRKEIRKYMRRRKRKSKDIIKNLDKKYNYFANDEEMTEEDNYVYSFNDGIGCMLQSFRGVIGYDWYYDRGSYVVSDWGKL